MANLTRGVIKAALLKLLNDRPLSQITVKDIVLECGINRNTFYYHDQGIPELIKEIVDDEAEAIIKNYLAMESLEDCLETIVRTPWARSGPSCTSTTPPAGTYTSNTSGPPAATWWACIWT